MSIKISELSNSNSLDGSEVLPIVQSGTTVKTSTQDIADLVTSATPSGNASGDLTGSYPSPTIANSAVTEAKLANSSVTANKIATQAVTTSKIADGAITQDQIADDEVITSKIQDDAITTVKILDGNVTSAKLANTAVTPGSYTSANITVDAKGRITAAANGSSGVTVTYESKTLTNSTPYILNKTYTECTASTSVNGYVDLPVSPSVGDTYYVTNKSANLNLTIEGSGTQLIHPLGTATANGQYVLGNTLNQVCKFVYLATDLWGLSISPSYISQEKTYKVYSALLTQVGSSYPSSKPTAIVLQNDFAGVTFDWDYDTVGLYNVTASGSVFTADKTFITTFITDTAHPKIVSANRVNNTVVEIGTYSDLSTGSNNFTKASFEIRVYN